MKKLILIAIVLFMLVGCSSKTPTIVSNTATGVLETQVAESNTLTPSETTRPIITDAQIPTMSTTILPLSNIDVYANEGNRYFYQGRESVTKGLQKWGFTEHGNNVENCIQPQAQFNIEKFPNEVYEYEIFLTAPQMRSLLEVLEDINDEVNDGKYSIEVTIEDGTIIDIGNVIDNSANIVWNEEMRHEPDELTPIEKAFLNYRINVNKSRFTTKEDILNKYLDPGECDYLDADFEWVSSEDNHRYGYVPTNHENDAWSALEIAARNTYAYNHIFRPDTVKILVFESMFGFGPPPCDEDPKYENYFTIAKLFDSDGIELNCSDELVVSNNFKYSILKIPEDGYITIKDYEYEKDTWVVSATLYLRDHALIRYGDPALAPWRLRMDYFSDTFNTFDSSNTPDLSELTLGYSEEEIISYTESLTN